MKIILINDAPPKLERMQSAYEKKLKDRGMNETEAYIASISYIKGIKDFIDQNKIDEIDIEKEIDEIYSSDMTTLKVRKFYAEYAKKFITIGFNCHKQFESKLEKAKDERINE